MRRRTSLDSALLEVEAGTLTNVSRMVVSRGWWDALSTPLQDDYRRRCLRQHIELSADDRISRHFVEVLGDADGPPLSSERRI
jgi:hypothetical protein